MIIELLVLSLAVLIASGGFALAIYLATRKQIENRFKEIQDIEEMREHKMIGKVKDELAEDIKTVVSQGAELKKQFSGFSEDLAKIKETKQQVMDDISAKLRDDLQVELAENLADVSSKLKLIKADEIQVVGDEVNMRTGLNQLYDQINQIRARWDPLVQEISRAGSDLNLLHLGREQFKADLGKELTDGARAEMDRALLLFNGELRKLRSNISKDNSKLAGNLRDLGYEVNNVKHHELKISALNKELNTLKDALVKLQKSNDDLSKALKKQAKITDAQRNKLSQSVATDINKIKKQLSKSRSVTKKAPAKKVAAKPRKPVVKRQVKKAAPVKKPVKKQVKKKPVVKLLKKEGKVERPAIPVFPTI